MNGVDLNRIAAIERSARAALPALREIEMPGWVWRISGGPTKRVNSANPVVAGATLDAVWASADRVYRDAGLPVRFRLTPLAAPTCDERLADADYAHVDASFTMTATLAGRTIDPAVRIAASADRDWIRGQAAASGWSATDAEGHRTLLAGLPPGSAVATLDEGDGPIAYGVAGLGEGRICLFDIVVAPGARGRGAGRRLVAGLLGGAAACGHREALLQVLATNTPARALYASLGFVDAYPYHYRVAA